MSNLSWWLRANLLAVLKIAKPGDARKGDACAGEGHFADVFVARSLWVCADAVGVRVEVGEELYVKVRKWVEGREEG